MSRRALLRLLSCRFSRATVCAEVPEYQAIRDARPDGRVINVENGTLDRDAFHFQFRKGVFHLLTPVNGRTIGAVFVGDGSYELTPSSESERRHLGIVTGDREVAPLNSEEGVSWSLPSPTKTAPMVRPLTKQMERALPELEMKRVAVRAPRYSSI